MAEEGQKVTLNVYDLSQGLARQLSTAFLGRPIEAIWHTGVVVYGNEYYFGGGIQHDPAGRTPYGKPIRTIDLGTTHVPKDIFETYLQEISPRYTAETYSLLSHNCNNFSNEVAQFLVGATIPDYILDLPNIVMSSPMGALILPMIQNLENTLKAGAVPMAPQFNPTSVGRSVPTANIPRSSPSGSGSNNTRSSSDAKPLEKTMGAGPQKSKANGTADPLGDARSKVQEEIGREFAAIMATGTLRASEAAALATKRVMQKTLSMADSKMLDDVDSDDIPHAFLCCVCLDLLYKPIVLSCGHISCFWCVHKSMNGFRESHCPICRRPYYHFPTICEMLHLLILKMYPMAYKRRQNQTLEEERKLGLFSPQYDSLACGSRAGEKIEHLEDSANGEMNANTKNDNVVAELILEENSEVVRSASVEILNSLGDLHGQNTQNQETVTVADVLCRACTQLLLRPVVLNCGHAFCESCINLRVETLECQVCQSLQPRGFPNVCLELDQFLKEQLPEEYKLRSDSVQLKLAETFKHESPTSCSSEGGKKGQGLPRWDEVASKVHPAVGCDSCGMYPIIGDRYKCEDCFEEVGFDLCGECYNTRSKRPGRFNQQHRPEHKFKLVLPTMFSTMRSRIVTEIMLEEGSTTFIIANDEGSESSEDIGAILELSSDARESEEDNSDVDVRTQTNSNDSRTDQNMSRPT